jgi:peroxiredoxin
MVTATPWANIRSAAAAMILLRVGPPLPVSDLAVRHSELDSPVMRSHDWTEQSIDAQETHVTFLTNGQPFPHLEVPAVGGGYLSLPEDLAGAYGVVLVYRGSWCPYCNAQLAAFSRATDELTEIGVKVVALSVDDEATSADLAAKHSLRFPLGHSADAQQVAAILGSYTGGEGPGYLQSTGFVLAPDGTVVTAVYSSGAIGRLVAGDVIGLVKYLAAQ